jgi:hypothetical protein
MAAMTCGALGLLEEMGLGKEMATVITKLLRGEIYFPDAD